MARGGERLNANLHAPDMAGTAANFAEGARRLLPAGSQLSDPGRHPEPAIVLVCLACEVGIKALLVKEQRLKTRADLVAFVGRGNGHRLDHLFSLLSCTVQQRIERYMIAFQPEHSEFVFKGRTVQDFARSILETVDTLPLRGHLERQGNGFEEWRYSYEAGRLLASSTFVFLLLDAVLRCLGHGPKSPSGAR